MTTVKELLLPKNSAIGILLKKMSDEFKTTDENWTSMFFVNINLKSICLSDSFYISYDDKRILGKYCLKVLLENGFKIPEESYTDIEFHCANSYGDRVLEGPLLIHRDSVNYSEITNVCFYIENNCESGGELAIYDQVKEPICFLFGIFCQDESNFEVVSKIDTRPLDDSYKVILIPGDVLHRPEPIKNGSRIMISVSFRSEV